MGSYVAKLDTGDLHKGFVKLYIALLLKSIVINWMVWMICFSEMLTSPGETGAYRSWIDAQWRKIKGDVHHQSWWLVLQIGLNRMVWFSLTKLYLSFHNFFFNYIGDSRFLVLCVVGCFLFLFFWRWNSTCVWCAGEAVMRTSCCCVMAVMTATTYSVLSHHSMMFPKGTGGVPSAWRRWSNISLQFFEAKLSLSLKMADCMRGFSHIYFTIP